MQEAQAAAVEAKGLEPLANDALLSAGDSVAVLKRGPFFARRATVEALLNKGIVLVHVDGVATEMGGALKLKRKDLARAPAGMPAPAPAKGPARKGRKVPKQLVGLDGTEQCTNQISRRFSPNTKSYLHAIDAPPVRRRGGSPSLLDSADQRCSHLTH